MHTEQIGNGSDLFLIHGWMMNGQCWRELTMQLKERHRLTTVDLPGHGGSLQSSYSFNRTEQLLSGLLELAPANAIWIGWSLGGLLAQLAATTNPGYVRAVISVGMSARHTAAADWQCGVNRALFRAIRLLFAASPAQLTRQLLDQQVLGSERQKHVRATLSTLATAPWEKRELKAGLGLLDTADARDAIQTFDKPILFIAGEKDLVVNKASLEQSANLAPQGHYVEIAGAGHAPFLSHPHEFTRTINHFINELN